MKGVRRPSRKVRVVSFRYYRKKKARHMLLAPSEVVLLNGKQASQTGLMHEAEERNQQGIRSLELSTLEEVDAELSKAFDELVRSNTSDEGGPIFLSRDIKGFLISFDTGETRVDRALSARRWPRPRIMLIVIRCLRMLLGEEPEPAVLTSRMREVLFRILTTLISSAMWPLGLIFCGVFAYQVWSGVLDSRMEGCTGYVVLVGVLVITLAVPMWELADIWRFGKLKRKLREKRKEIINRTQSGDRDWNSSLDDNA